MLRRLHVGACLGVVVFLSAVSGAAEHPTAETIRTAAKAARAALVEIEAEGGAIQGMQAPHGMLPFVVPQPQQPGQPNQRDFRFHFQVPPQEGQQPDNDGMQQFFRNFDRGRLAVGGKQTCLGVVVRVKDGKALIAAPHSVTGRAHTIRVKTAAGRTLEAKRLGTDERVGLSCLEVQDDTLKAIVPAPQPAQAGDWILAVGNALSIGIVSATDRPGARRAPVLLADILVPARMAGAPLVDLQGRLVAVAIPSGGDRHFAQAVPTAAAAAAIDALAKDGRIRRGFLGIILSPLSADIRQQLQIDHGVQVQKAMEGQAAQKAGIRDGDIVLAVDGKKAQDTAGFIARVNAKRPGETVVLKIKRGNEVSDVPVVLGERPEDPAALVGRPRRAEPGTKLDIGVTVTPVTPELAAMHRLRDAKGLVVTHVAARGLAEKARPKPIKPGELIGEIDKKPVTAVEQAKAAIAEARKNNAKTLLLLVRGSEGARYVVIDLKPKEQ
ncbi:PDZ domain-containing protein [bacterium]|nr:PDZ domain-containing protein [bacterium]